MRNRFFDWWFSVFPTHTRVDLYNVEQYDVEDAYELLKQYAPTYIPDGFILTEAVEAHNYYKLVYQDGSDGWIIYNSQIAQEGAIIRLNTEDAEVEPIRINGSEGYFINQNGDLTITWSNVNYHFSLSCNVSKDEAIKIVNSTK